MWRECSGSSTTIIVEFRAGRGFTPTTMLPKYTVYSICLTIDFVNIEEFTFEFELEIPFKPFEQLMGVLPEASKDLVPACYRVILCF